MINIPLQSSENQDIYDYGFDKSLNRTSEDTITSPIVYNNLDEATQAQQIQFGSLLVGSSDTNITTDPEQGMWIGGEKIANAPFSVDMDGNLKASASSLSGTITASAGSIGGFEVGSDYIRDVANTMGLT